MHDATRRLKHTAAAQVRARKVSFNYAQAMQQPHAPGRTDLAQTSVVDEEYIN